MRARQRRGSLRRPGRNVLQFTDLGSGGHARGRVRRWTTQGSYTVDGDRITITAPIGDQSVLTIDAAGCLAHPLIGTYCRDDGAAVASSTAEIYEAEAEEGRIALEFGAARRVRVTMTPFAGSNAPERMSFDARYDVDGDHMIVRLPGDERLVLTRTGGSLEGRMNGETVRFVKR